MSSSSRSRSRSRKRSSPIAASENEEGEEEEGPQDDPSSPPPRRKQKRTASPSPEKEQDKENSQNGQQEDNDENEEDEDQEIASPLRCINPPHRPPEAGVIKRVHVENFMCHRKLTVDLCRNVNFISGQNGSGKSAVLAAIQICLGAGARRTHRARNLKELVRKEAGEHCSGAKLRVTLRNGGPDGFQQDVYGDTITVERNISLRPGGTNGYKLLDAKGVVHSTAKRDLDAMLDQLNIQVENPVAVLDQEEAKQFLTGKARDKYNFFAKATELERMDRSYASVVDNVTALQEQKDKAEQSLQHKVDNVRALQREWQQYQALDKLQEKVLEYRADYAWAIYNQSHTALQAEQETLDKFVGKRQRRQAELTQVEASLTNTSTGGDDPERVAKEERLEQLTEEADEAAKTKRSLEADLKHAQAPIKAKERDINSLRREQAIAARNLQTAKQALKEERERILAASGESEEAQRAATLKQAEEEWEELQHKQQQWKQDTTMSQRKYDEMEPSIREARVQGDAIKNQIAAIDEKLRRLQHASNSSDSKLGMYGRSCPRVHQLVQQARQEGRWTGPVDGPIGAHITIASGKEQYAALAEFALGANKSLDRFVVTNNRDRQLFQRFREQAGCSSQECGIYQVADSPSRYNIPPPPPDHGVETVASCLNVDSVLIFNAMVDHLRMDARAVCENKQVSEEALLVRTTSTADGGGGRMSIKGGTIKEVFFLPHGDRWTVTNGNLSLASHDRPLKKTLGVDHRAAIAGLQEEKSQLTEELKEHRARLTQLEREQKVYQKKWNLNRRKTREGNERLEQLAEIIDRVRAESEEAANVTVDTSELEQDVSNAEQTVETLQEQLSDRTRELEELIPQVDHIKNRLEEVTARNEKVLADMKDAEEDIETYLQTMEVRAAKLEKTRAKLEQMQTIISGQEANVEKAQAKRDAALLKARQMHFTHLRDVERKKKEEQKEGDDDDDDEGNNASRNKMDESSLSPSAAAAAGEHNGDEPTEEELLAIEPVETTKEPDFYKSKIERAKIKIQKERERRRLKESDPQVAFEKFMRAQKDLDGKMKQIAAIEETVVFLAKDLKNRRKKWRRFRGHLSHFVNETFNEILNRKGSSGELEFSHEEGTLDLVVQKDSSQDSSQTKDAKAMSGGERSFTTLALLLAMGERLETPFRVMDEFDVFLDPVARKIALDTLVELAKEMEHRQFIFITPQDLSALKTDPMLKIHRLKPPARDNDRAGGLTQQTLD